MSGLSPDETYELLRALTSPVVAISCGAGGRVNGMVADSAVRASLSTRVPRVAVFVHKWNWSHELIFRGGAFVMHLLHRGQWELIHRWGFSSGRERDKWTGIAHRAGALGLPVLEDCYAYLECRVVNAMDAGGSTCFLADVVEAGRGPGRDVMTADYFRANLPEAWRPRYLERLKAAQAYADEHATPIRPLVWRGPESAG